MMCLQDLKEACLNTRESASVVRMGEAILLERQVHICWHFRQLFVHIVLTLSGSIQGMLPH